MAGTPPLPARPAWILSAKATIAGEDVGHVFLDRAILATPYDVTARQGALP
jgi:hypothetical protein